MINAVIADQCIVAGFVTLWALNFVTAIAAGFALETMLSLLGVPFLPFFLILWIICASLPPLHDGCADHDVVNISEQPSQLL